MQKSKRNLKNVQTILERKEPRKKTKEEKKRQKERNEIKFVITFEKDSAVSKMKKVIEKRKLEAWKKSYNCKSHEH